MGYSTDFYGQINISPIMESAAVQVLNTWLANRHVVYDVARIYEYDPDADSHTIDGQPVGQNGWNWLKGVVDNSSPYEPFSPAVVDYNDSTPTPSLWSDLELTDDGSAIVWNGSEKTYEMAQWLQFLCDNLFAVHGHVLNGQLKWQGEDFDDSGIITVANNVVRVEYLEPDDYLPGDGDYGYLPGE